jgi:SH3-like domain-containing protein
MKKLSIIFILFITAFSCTQEVENDIYTHKEEETSDVQSEIENERQPNLPDVDNTSNTANCSESNLMVYLNDPDKEGTNIRKNPGGEIVKTLILDEKNQGYMMYITKARNGWFKIEGSVHGVSDEIQLPKNTGWIHSSVIAVGTRNYGGQHLNIMNRANGEVVITKIKEESYGIRILDLCGDWVKIRYKEYEGWIENEWLCGSPFTTCS